MEKEFEEQLLGISVTHAAAQKAFNVIKAQEKIIESLREDVTDEADRNITLESRISDLENEKETAEDKVKEMGAPENLCDELKLKVTQRLYRNLTLQQLDDLESYVKSNFITGNYKDF